MVTTADYSYGMPLNGTIKSAEAPSPFVLVGALASEIASLDERLGAVAGRLVGGLGMAQSDGEAKQPPSRGGALGDLEAATRASLARVEHMNAALSAIERQLP